MVRNVEPDHILVRLKRETAEIHQRIEDQMAFADDDFRLPDYKKTLVDFYNFYRRFEPEMVRALEQHKIAFDYQPRLKTPKLAMDLRNLNISPPEIPNVAAEIIKIDSAGAVFGALYVIEGSTLGGQIIARILKARFDLDESNGAAFFAGYGAETGARWNEFRLALTEYAQSNDDHDAIVRAALETFERIGEGVGKG